MVSQPSRRQVLAGVSAFALAGCLGRSGSSGATTDDSTSVAESSERKQGAPTATPSSGDDGPLPPTRADPLSVAYSFDELRDGVRSGGPPKDGIPSIDDPQFVEADDAPEKLAPGDVVFGVVRDGEAKAYPQYVLVWHEIVNDVLGGDPVTVTYCPLTGTAMGFERGETTFGVSGRLLNSNLVMYDRGTDSRWPQMLATAISGPMEGESLREFRLVWTTWDQWRTAHPGTTVLSEETGYVRDYGRDPYGNYNPRRGYYERDSTLFAPLAEDDRFTAKEVVFGSRPRTGPLALRKSALKDTGLAEVQRSDETFVGVYDDRLDTAYLYRNPDRIEFTREDGRAVAEDDTSYAPDELPLERVYLFDAMWFAWAGFYPNTSVHD